jgi:hypothetical protein
MAKQRGDSSRSRPIPGIPASRHPSRIFRASAPLNDLVYGSYGPGVLPPPQREIEGSHRAEYLVQPIVYDLLPRLPHRWRSELTKADECDECGSAHPERSAAIATELVRRAGRVGKAMPRKHFTKKVGNLLVSSNHDPWPKCADTLSRALLVIASICSANSAPR